MSRSRVLLAAVSVAALLWSHVSAASAAEVLHERSRCEFREVPLNAVAKYLSDLHDIQFVLAKGVDGDERITFEGEAELGVVLTQMLNPLTLKHRVEGNRLMIFPIVADAYRARLLEKAANDKKAKELEQQASEQLTKIGGEVSRNGDGWIWKLELRGEDVVDERLAPLQDLHHLDQLDLNGCPITDVGLVHLKNLRWLITLDLSNTKVTDAGLVNLQGLTRLRVLRAENTEITKDGRDLLRRANKDIRVILKPADERPVQENDPFGGGSGNPFGTR